MSLRVASSSSTTRIAFAPFWMAMDIGAGVRLRFGGGPFGAAGGAAGGLAGTGGGGRCAAAGGGATGRPRTGTGGGFGGLEGTRQSLHEVVG